MTSSRRLLAGVLLALVSIGTKAAPPDQTLAIKSSAASYELRVPVSRLVMTIPRGELVADDSPRTGAGESPRYFHFVDSKHGVVVSGWLEPARSYPGFDTFWKGETDAWAKQHLPAPKNLSRAQIDGWESAIYDLDVPVGNNTHIRAEWVQLGTWIDLHISVTTSERLETARDTALSLLKNIHIAAVQ